ncbi:hypothetical protein [Pseudoxanthomonas indica]|uniref:Bacteriophage Rz lysis protein n=1 Tax=Pseudoxanthomonas indica TaxID=428993 RepID=A0A1T5K0X2_9GAMM|nr:hypothetical protein [Pseudoxanthomonas indica]GGD45744.1 hypothetical protein GCM10007235_17110 [Pseudoxanthomonas indica]SKC57190.1 hypothetical protein SAMN06296058_1252 [Pseudoxanthomonas indica]
MGLSALSVKPLLIALTICLVALLTSNAGWWVRASVLSSERDVAVADRAVLATSKDAYKVRVGELTAANRVYDAEYSRLAKELQLAQGETARLNAEGDRAVAAAQAKADEADRVLKTFMERYAQQVRVPDCAQALSTIQRLCPALGGY